MEMSNLTESVGQLSTSRASGLLTRRETSAVVIQDSRYHEKAESIPFIDNVQVLPFEDKTGHQSAPHDHTRKQYFLHMRNGMTFNGLLKVGTGGCNGVDNCQFIGYDGATKFCDATPSCKGVVQARADIAGGCAGGFGCFFPATGEMELIKDFAESGGQTYEKQILSYKRFGGGKKLSVPLPIGTRGCTGKRFCEFGDIDSAMAFCDGGTECLGVLQVPKSLSAGTNCVVGCYIPAKGEIVHDPLWMSRSGVTYLKQQEVAYMLREDGYAGKGRFPAGVGTCKGSHNCKFHSLDEAKEFCDSNPTCNGVLQRAPDPDADQSCGGNGCFEPCRGSVEYNGEWLVTESKFFQRNLVR